MLISSLLITIGLGYTLLQSKIGDLDLVVNNVNDIPSLAQVDNPPSVFEDGEDIIINITPEDGDLQDLLELELESSNTSLVSSDDISIDTYIAVTGTQRIIQRFCLVLSNVKKTVENIIQLDIANASAGAFIFLCKSNGVS